MKNNIKWIFAVSLFFAGLTGTINTAGCGNIEKPESGKQVEIEPPAQRDLTLLTGAERIYEYESYLRDKKIGLVVNHTSLVNGVHLADTLLNLNIDVRKIFAPEHGFRGTADAGEHVATANDEKTGLPVISLYGANKKPAAEAIKDLDIIVFDIQDVGARFYTYISTMHYVMEACAENDVEFIVFDRPNPNGHYIDGPVLDMEYQSFVGMHPVPVVHGMTIAEYARMINGEGWLAGGVQCNLKYIICSNYTHNTKYQLPVSPSPNLPDMKSVYLYPSTCFFEGTIMSVGRGTNIPFQIYGHPGYPDKDFAFTPESRPGAKHPKFEGQICYGERPFADDPEKIADMDRIYIGFVADAYDMMGKPADFFTPFFNKLAGTGLLAEKIKEGMHPEKIRDNWMGEIQLFKEIRKKYLLYPDFK